MMSCNISWKRANTGLEATDFFEKGLKVCIFARKPDFCQIEPPSLLVNAKNHTSG